MSDAMAEAAAARAAQRDAVDPYWAWGEEFDEPPLLSRPAAIGLLAATGRRGTDALTVLAMADAYDLIGVYRR